MDKISQFVGENSFLSNFARAEVVWENIVWPTSEHAYQAAKTLDHQSRINIANLSTPAQAKQAGRTLVLRPDWESVKLEVMYSIVHAKFKQNPELLEKLLATGDAYLEEGNNHNDRIWGVCPPNSGNGKNLLGKVLMAVRMDLHK